MTTRDVLFSEPIPLARREEFERHVYYISDEIEGFDLIVGERGIDGVTIRTARSAPAAEAAVRAARNRYTGERPNVPGRSVWRRDAARPYAGDTFERMSAAGMARRSSSGMVWVDRRVAVLMDALDHVLTRGVKATFGAVEYRYPTLMPAPVLRRGGYHRSFPHLLMFVTRLHADERTYDAMMRDAEDGASVPSGYCAMDLCLPPTMCYHTYQQFADAPLPAAACVVTARGKSFRFESKYEKHLERLWDFTIREVVFMGPSELVSRQRDELMRYACARAEAWGLTGVCETASDPFFGHAGGHDGSTPQRLLGLKYELRLDVGGGETVAAASFNLHHGFFAEAFRITLPDGRAAHTACAGFGLERLAYAVLCQHGLDPAGWPEELRAQIEPEVYA